MIQDVLISAEAHAFVDRDYSAVSDEELPLWERAKALKVLTTESDSFTRLGAGLVAWIAGAAGAAALAAVVWSGAPIWIRLISLVAAIALLAASALLGRSTWQAGKRVVDAYCWWTLLPERLPDGGAGVENWRASPVQDAVLARVFMFEGWRLLRLVLSVMAFFAPLFVLLSLQEGSRFEATWQESQGASITVFVLVLALVSVLAGIATFGGLFRANRAHAERDPIQRRILRRGR